MPSQVSAGGIPESSDDPAQNSEDIIALATQAQSLAPKASPVLTGVPTAPLVQFSDQSSDPSTPSGSSNFYGKTAAGPALPTWEPEIGLPYQLNPALWSKTQSLVVSNGSTGVQVIGVGSTGNSGTGSFSAGANGIMTNWVTASSTNVGALVRLAAQYRIGTGTDAFGGIRFRSRVYVPDASYANSGASTGSRVMAGISAALQTSLATDDGGTATAGMFFSYCNVNGGVTDTNWSFITCSGSAKTKADTGLVFNPQHLYDFEIFIAFGTSTVYWKIIDLTAGTSASGTATATLPSSGALLGGGAGVQTINATTRNIQFAQLYFASDKG